MDAQWAVLQPFLPSRARTGRPRADDCRTLEAILYVFRTGCRWRDLPREYGAPATAWRRLRRWQQEGVWERIWRSILSSLDAQGNLDWGKPFSRARSSPRKRGRRRWPDQARGGHELDARGGWRKVSPSVSTWRMQPKQKRVWPKRRSARFGCPSSARGSSPHAPSTAHGRASLRQPRLPAVPCEAGRPRVYSSV